MTHMPDLPEPAYQHGTPPRSASCWSTSARRRRRRARRCAATSRNSSSDPRVVEIPRPLWWLILNGIILNTRPAKSAAEVRADLDRRRLAAQGAHRAAGQAAARLAGPRGIPIIAVDWAMRYGEPVGRLARWTQLKAADCTRILVLPLYPQYAASTTASDLRCRRRLAATHAQPAGTALRAQLPRPSRLHRGAGSRACASTGWSAGRAGQAGDELPRRTPLRARPGRSLPLRMPEDRSPAGARSSASRRRQYLVTFQSRFGRAEWLQALHPADAGRAGQRAAWRAST